MTYKLGWEAHQYMYMTVQMLVGKKLVLLRLVFNQFEIKIVLLLCDFFSFLGLILDSFNTFKQTRESDYEVC